MRKKWIWIFLILGAFAWILKIWLIPNWYSTNQKNIAFTYKTPILATDFDELLKNKTGLYSPLSVAQFAQSCGLKLNVTGTTTLVIQPKTSLLSFIRLLVRYQREQKLVLVQSHWNLKQFRKQLSKQFGFTEAALGEALMDPNNHIGWNQQTWLSRRGIDSFNWQALAIPNSYLFKSNSTPKQVLDRLVREAHDFWTKERILAAKDLGLNPVEVVNLASIVTKESNHITEFGKIASTYKNRLKMGMLLQADPTVVFARGRVGRVLNKDTKIKSPYNTYMHKGLPIGALCIPSVQAIDSCLFGAQYPYLYFCAKADLTPQHDFAISLEEHNKNARRYHKALNEFQKKKF